jgi:hypothetical protein
MSGAADHAAPRMRRATLATTTLACLLLASSLAHAEPTSDDKVAAEALFAEGRALLAEAKVPEACAKFEASQRLDPTLGTLLNLADCLERNGQSASAWLRFLTVARAAHEAKQTKREQVARSRAAALEPTLSRLRIVVKGSAPIEVRRNGAVVDAATFGTAVPMDPGTFVIEARAAGRKPWSTRVLVHAEAELVTVNVPAPEELAEDGAAPPALPVAEPRAAAGGGGPTTTSHLPVGFWIAGAFAVVGAGVGTFLGLAASSKWDAAKEACGAECTSATVEDGRDARSLALGSTLSFAASGVALATAVVFLITHKPTPQAQALSPSMTAGPGGVGFAVTGLLF